MDPIRITIRHPDGQRDVRLIARTSTITSLYCLVRDALSEMTQATDREGKPIRVQPIIDRHVIMGTTRQGNDQGMLVGH